MEINPNGDRLAAKSEVDKVEDKVKDVQSKVKVVSDKTSKNSINIHRNFMRTSSNKERIKSCDNDIEEHKLLIENLQLQNDILKRKLDTLKETVEHEKNLQEFRKIMLMIYAYFTIREKVNREILMKKQLSSCETATKFAAKTAVTGATLGLGGYLLSIGNIIGVPLALLGAPTGLSLAGDCADLAGCKKAAKLSRYASKHLTTKYHPKYLRDLNNTELSSTEVLSIKNASLKEFNNKTPTTEITIPLSIDGRTKHTVEKGRWTEPVILNTFRALVQAPLFNRDLLPNFNHYMPYINDLNADYRMPILNC